MAIINVPGAFLGTTLVGRSNTGGKGKGVFVPLEGQKNDYQFPTYGGTLMNPFKGAAKLFAGDLAEFRTDSGGKNGKYYILKTFMVVSSSSTTTHVMRGDFFHIPFVGDTLMVAPTTIGGKGTVVTVSKVEKATVTVSEVTYDTWKLTTSATLGNPAKDTILVEGEEAGSNKAMVVKKINSVCPCDYDFYYDPSITYNTEGDSNFTDARYNVAFALGGTMYIEKMSPMPQCVLDLNRSNVTGWYRVAWYDMEAVATKSEVAEQTGGIALSYSADAPTTSTVGKVGDIITNGSKIYVCTNVSGSTYTWKGAAIS